MSTEQQRTLATLHAKLVEAHPNWPPGKAKWIAMQALGMLANKSQ